MEKKIISTSIRPEFISKEILEQRIEEILRLIKSTEDAYIIDNLQSMLKRTNRDLLNYDDSQSYLKKLVDTLKSGHRVHECYCGYPEHNWREWRIDGIKVYQIDDAGGYHEDSADGEYSWLVHIPYLNLAYYVEKRDDVDTVDMCTEYVLRGKGY